MRVWGMLALQLAALVGPARAEQAASQRAARAAILVYDTQAVDLPQASADLVNAALIEQLSRRQDLSVLTLADLDALLANSEDRRQLGCDEDPACLAALSAKVHADQALSSWIGEVGGRAVLSLALVDAARAAVVERATASAPSLEEAVAQVPALLAQILGWSEAASRPAYKLPGGQAVSFAVFDLKPGGVPAPVAANLTQVLAAAVKQVRGTTVVSSDDVDAMLQLAEEQDRLDCVEDTACLAEIAGALGVDKLIVGNVGLLGGRYVISLRLIDVPRAEVQRNLSESYQGQEDQLIAAVRHCARELLGVRPEQGGTLAVGADPPGAALLIDGQERGRLPMAPVQGLAPGRHEVRLERDGYLQWQTEVYVEPDAATAVWAELQERPRAWYQRWWVWALVGGGVASAAAVGGGLVFWALQPRQDYGSFEISYTRASEP